MWKIALVLVAAAGCIAPDLVTCADGLACPASDRCDEVHHTCVLPGQLAVCAGAGDGTDCTADSISGGCFDGVCLSRGCGNRVVEPGEMCDDGNQISGDGCSGDCRSTEVCGNGFLDPGEACDDGALLSHDGCDSGCKPETAAWSKVIAVAPDVIEDRLTAYDAARGRLVYAGLRGTWEWDGARWLLFDVFAAPDAVFYDPEHERVEMIASDLLNATHLYAWIDAQWLAVDSEAGPALDGVNARATAVYDLARHRVMVIETGTSDTSQTWTIDAMGAWVPLSPLPGSPGPSFAVFDAASGEVVVETKAAIEWIYDGVAWTPRATAFGAYVSVAYDPDRGHLVLVDDDSQTMYERIGAAWQAIDGAEVPCRRAAFDASPPAYYDPTSAALVLFSSDASEVCRWDGAWTANAPAVPFSPIGATYDPVTRSFVVLHNAHPTDPASATELWALTADRWHRIETLHAPTGRVGALAVYSPGRAATVLYGERTDADPGGGPSSGDCDSTGERQADTWSFDGSDWTWLASLSTSSPPCTKSAATYDAEHGRVLLATYNELWSLGDADHAWVRLELPPSLGQVYGIGWDAHSGSLVAARIPEGDFPSPLFELRGGDWTPLDVIPGALGVGSSAFVNDQRGGGVIAIQRELGVTWERAGTSWTPLPAAPLHELFSAWTAYDPVSGDVFYLGRTQGGVFASILTRTSTTPFESCRAGEDADGDGLAGCDDPDCYWACSRCLPHTTCR